MSIVYQLDLFEPIPSENEMLRAELIKVKESSDKVRKSLFARHGHLQKKYDELNERMAIIERHICTKPEKIEDLFSYAK